MMTHASTVIINTAEATTAGGNHPSADNQKHSWLNHWNKAFIKKKKKIDIFKFKEKTKKEGKSYLNQ